MALCSCRFCICGFNCGLQNIQEKINPESPKAKLEFATHGQLFFVCLFVFMGNYLHKVSTLHFQLFTKHLHCTRYYKYLGLEVYGSVCKYSGPFYIRGLSILNVGIRGGGNFGWVIVMEQSPADTNGHLH